MDWESEIKDKLGSENVAILIKAIQDGRIQSDELKLMANYMDGNVNGVYVQNEKKGHDLTYLFRLMLDGWYQYSLYNKTKEDAQKELYNILKKVGLNAIAHKLKTTPESDTRER